MRLVYTARKRLIAGHLLDEEYEIFGPHEEALPSDQSKIDTQTSISGVREEDLSHTAREWSVVSDHIDGTELLQYDEFFWSVTGGFQFIFDPDSDLLGVDVNPINCTMVSTTWRPRRTNPLTFKLSFKVREVF